MNKMKNKQCVLLMHNNKHPIASSKRNKMKDQKPTLQSHEEM